MNLVQIFSILIIHWFADFVLQTDEQAKGKSKNWFDLLNHTINYSCIWAISIIFLFPNHWKAYQYVTGSIIFCLITFICHTVTDYFTSRLNSRLWEQKKVHNFFVLVGFDQVLHYIQLFTTYYLLK